MHHLSRNFTEKTRLLSELKIVISWYRMAQILKTIQSLKSARLLFEGVPLSTK